MSLRVNLVILTIRQSLPVYPWMQSLSVRAGMSQKCLYGRRPRCKRNMTFSAKRSGASMPGADAVRHIISGHRLICTDQVRFIAYARLRQSRRSALSLRWRTTRDLILLREQTVCLFYHPRHHGPLPRSPSLAS